MTGYEPIITVTGGLTLDGSIDLGSADGSYFGQLDFQGAQTLGGTGSIDFCGNPYDAINTTSSGDDTGTLTPESVSEALNTAVVPKGCPRKV